MEALEDILLRFDKQEMTSFLENYPDAFDEAIQSALSDKHPFCWRAAWLLCGVIKDNDPRIQGFIPNIINVLPDRNDGHQRELIKILLRMELDEEYEGALFDICMNIWEQIEKSSSVRVTALKMIMKLVKKYPDLSSEISFITQDHYLDTLTPGVRRSVRKMMRNQ